MANVASFDELALEGLRDIYDAENQVLAAFPDLIDAVTLEQLRAALIRHQAETREHVYRLEQIFASLGVSPEGKECPAARGLLREVREVIQEITPGPLRDAALVGAMQKFEHYEIASYGTARTFAEQRRDDRAVRLLEQTLVEEKKTDETLSEVAVSAINPVAATT